MEGDGGGAAVGETYRRYWEDFHPGETLSYGEKRVTREEIVEFAREFDPQPFHLDDAAGAATHFGGLVASGWQSCGFAMRMLVDHVLRDSTSMGSPGVKSLRWLKPVRPGDTLHMHQTTLSTARHPHRRDIGFVNSRFEMLNQHDAVVLRMESGGMFLLRHPEAP
ncbi:MAG: MaoC family dehydratase [Nevskiaceae bacterium]|nr:MAG: MaoC family dehydratase [Nevskiaceae bacterium]TBR72735.1 MAG: MaoC family dehydratase [Nevskiaceae bacterium]